MASECSRRRVLALSAAGLTSLSGCSTIYGRGGLIEPDRHGTVAEPPGGTQSGENSTGTDGPANQPPETPAATFRTESGDTFALRDFTHYIDWAIYGDGMWSYDPPDDRIIRMTVDEITPTVEVKELKLHRDIRLKARYKTRDGSVATTDPTTVSPESDGYQTYEWELPFDGSALPRRQRAVVKLIGQDAHTDDNTEYVLKEYHCAVVPYRNSEGSGRHYLDSEDLTYNVYRGNIALPERLYTEYIDTAEERIRFFALAYPIGEPRILTGYTNVPHDDYYEYMENRTNNDYRMNHHPQTYVYNADDVEMFTSLADSFAASLDEHGILDHFDRLQELAYFVGCFTYQLSGGIQKPQVYTLYNEVANCTAASMLYLALMNTEAFNNTRGAFIACQLRYRGDWEGHAVIGIDERDIDPPDPEAIYWVEPSQEERDSGLPDTRYAFLELTKPRDIGAFDADKYDLGYIIDSTELDMNPEFREFGHWG